VVGVVVRGAVLSRAAEEGGVATVDGGQVAVQEFRAACNYPVLEYSVKASTKMARNEAVSPLAESGKVWLPHPARAPWVTELIGFPDLPHDDRCDAARLAILQGWGKAARAILSPPAVATPVGWERGGMRVERHLAWKMRQKMQLTSEKMGWYGLSVVR
jgi:hypothetical protein